MSAYGGAVRQKERITLRSPKASRKFSTPRSVNGGKLGELIDMGSILNDQSRFCDECNALSYMDATNDM